jgi:hypothetical protein
MDDWLAERAEDRSCLIKMVNNDQLCLSRAIVTGIAKHESILNSAKKKQWNNICRGDKVDAFFFFCFSVIINCYL